MSNRPESRRGRRIRMWRNSAKTRAFRMMRRRADGEVVRSGGPENYAYGPVTTSKGVLTMHKEAAREKRAYPSGSPRERYEAMTRDELRAVCKAQSVTGYGKMNKAQLIEAALR